MMTKISVYVCLLFALTFVEMNPINKDGRVGTNLTVKCSNWQVWTDVKDNVKYFCRDPCSKKKHVIVGADYRKTALENRIKIVNSENGLYVTFINLQKSDSGKYYCGVERFGNDAYLEVNINVTDAEPSSPKMTPETVHAAVTTSPSTSSKSSTVSTVSTVESLTNVSTVESSTNKTLYSSTTYAMQSQHPGSVWYLIISLTAVTSLLLLLIIVWKKKKKQEKAVSGVHLQQDDVLGDVQYDEIRPEDQQPESSTALEHFADPDSVYANCSVLQRIESAAQGDNYYSNYASVNPAPSSGVHSRGASSRSTDTDLQSDFVYSLAQLPNQKMNPAGQSEPNQSESHKNEIIYAVVKKPRTT